MNPIEDSYLRNRLKKLIYDNYEDGLKYYDRDPFYKHSKDINEEEEVLNTMDNYTNGGNIVNNVYGGSKKLLNATPPLYQDVPISIINGGLCQLCHKIISNSMDYNRDPYKDLTGVIGRGVLIGGIYPELVGGSFFSSIKKGLKGIEDEAKKAIQDPLDFTSEVASYVGDILPDAAKTATKIVANPLGTPKYVGDYVEEIKPTAEKHMHAFHKKYRQKGKGACCQLCANKRKGGCCVFCRGGLSADILDDPEFKNKLAARREIINDAEEIKNELMEEYNDIENDDDEDEYEKAQDLQEIEDEIGVTDNLIDNLYEQEELQYFDAENLDTNNDIENNENMNDIKQDMNEAISILNNKLKFDPMISQRDQQEIISDIEELNVGKNNLNYLDPSAENKSLADIYNENDDENIHEQYSDILKEKINYEDMLNENIDDEDAENAIEARITMENYLNDWANDSQPWNSNIGNYPTPDRERNTEMEREFSNREYTDDSYPIDLPDNSRSLTLRPLLNNIDCPDLDPSFKLISEYIDFVYPQLPIYIRASMAKNLYSSLRI